MIFAVFPLMSPLVGFSWARAIRMASATACYPTGWTTDDTVSSATEYTEHTGLKTLAPSICGLALCVQCRPWLKEPCVPRLRTVPSVAWALTAGAHVNDACTGGGQRRGSS